jgi:hypothetical protein
MLTTFLLIIGFESTDRVITYYTHIDMNDVISLITEVSWSGIKKNGLESILFLFTGLIIATVSIISTSHLPATKARCKVFALQLLFYWPGFLGVLSIPDTISDFKAGNLDGEWLGESWPVMEAMGIWIILSIINFIIEWRLVKSLHKNRPSAK